MYLPETRKHKSCQQICYQLRKQVVSNDKQWNWWTINTNIQKQTSKQIYNLPVVNLFLTRDSLYSWHLNSKFNLEIVAPLHVNWTAIREGVLGPCVKSNLALSVPNNNNNNKSQNKSTIFAQQITAGFIKFVLQLRCGTYWLRTEKIAIYLWEVDINIV